MPNQGWPWAVAASLCFGCTHDAQPSAAAAHTIEASPNASITPSPLLSGSNLAPKLPKQSNNSKATKGTPEREVVSPLPIHQPLPSDEEPSKFSLPLVLRGKFSWPSFPSTLRLWGVDAERQTSFINDTQRTLEFTLRPHGRMQLAFGGRAFPFDDRSLLQARYENTGHVLVWPDGASYRVLPAGVLRSLFGEARPDATPMTNLEPESHAGGNVLGYTTRVWTFETPQGKLTLHQALVPEAELAAPLVCRFLVELMSITPTTGVCESQRLPLRAEFEVGDGARALFEATRFDVAPEGTATALLVPPKGSTHRNFGIPAGRELLSSIELGMLRRGDKLGTLTAHNATGRLRYVLLDGVPVGRVAPRSSIDLTSLSQGQYLARLVDFWGNDAWDNNVLALTEASTLGEPLSVPAEPEL
jgi:hypothetical protein